jgi:hypothetical protein
MSPVEKLRRIVANAKGDDLERFESLFRNIHGIELDRIYEHSGFTYREVLEKCRQGRRDWEAARDLLERLLRETGL